MLSDTCGGDQADTSEPNCRNRYFNDSKVMILNWKTKKKIENAKLDENLCRTLKELALELGVAQRTIGQRLHAMGKIRKQ